MLGLGGGLNRNVDGNGNGGGRGGVRDGALATTYGFFPGSVKGEYGLVVGVWLLFPRMELINIQGR